MLAEDVSAGGIRFGLAVEEFVASIPDLDRLGPHHMVDRSPDALTAAWRIWAVAQTLSERGASDRTWAWLRAGAELVTANPEHRLVRVEYFTALGAENVKGGNEGHAIPFLQAAHAWWTELLEELMGARAADSPPLATLVTTQLEALNCRDRGSEELVLRSWAAQRPLLAMKEILPHRVRVAGVHRDLVAARAEAQRGHEWLDRWYTGVRLYAVALVRSVLQAALVDVEWEALAFEEALASSAVAADYIPDDGALGSEVLRRSLQLHIAPMLVVVHRAAEAIGLLDGLDEWFARHGLPEGAFRARSAQLFARWQLSPDPGIEADLRALIHDWERYLRESDASIGTRMGFAAKAHLTAPYRLLLEVIAADPCDRQRDYAAVLLALREPGELGALDVLPEPPELPGVLEVIASYLEPGTCVLFADVSATALTFAIVESDGPSISAGSDELLEALQSLQTAYHEAMARRRAGLDVGTGLDIETAGAAVWAALPAEVRRAIEGAQTILYSPDANTDIDELPLELVRTPDDWLGTMATIARFPSPGAILTRLAPRPPAPERSRTGLVAVAGAPEGFPELTAAEAEATDIVRFLGLLELVAARVDVDSAEGLASVLASECSVLHYVGHGAANQLSEAALAGPGGALERDAIPVLHGELMCFFSCCELARMRFVRGGGSRGFAEALLDHGAAAVVTYTQPVPDGDAARLAREFYRAAARAPVGSAVRLARARAIEKGVSPAVAASLVLVGDPRATLTGAPLLTAEQWSSSLLRSIALDEPHVRALGLLPPRGWSDAVQRWLGGQPPPWSERLALCARVRVDDLRGGCALRILAATERMSELGWDGPEDAIVEHVRELSTASWLARQLGERLVWAALRAQLPANHDFLPYETKVWTIATSIDEIAHWRAVPGVDSLFERTLNRLTDVMERNDASAKDPAAAFARADDLRSQGDADEARAVLNSLIEGDDPTYAPVAALNLGVMLHEADDPLGALVPLERALNSSHPLAAPRASLLIGQIMHVAGCHAEARPYYQRAAATGDQFVVEQAQNGLQALVNLAADAKRGKSFWRRRRTRRTKQSLHTKTPPADALTVHDYIQDADARASARTVADAGWMEALDEAASEDERFAIGLAAAEQGNIAIASKSWLPLARRGISDAMFNLGVLLQDSDPDQAREWWQRAAQAGHADAMYNLGVLLKDSDPDQARRWYERAAQAGHTERHAQPGAAAQRQRPGPGPAVVRAGRAGR